MLDRSALLMSVTKSADLSGRTTPASRPPPAPIPPHHDPVGFHKSETAVPSRRNSGFDTTSKGTFFSRAAEVSRTRSPVLTGTVDFSTMTV